MTQEQKILQREIIHQKNNLKINFKKYTFISYQYNILSKFKKKKLNSAGTSPMGWFYKEK